MCSQETMVHHVVVVVVGGGGGGGGYSGIRREERVRRSRKGGYIEGTGRIQWEYSESTVGTVSIQ